MRFPVLLKFRISAFLKRMWLQKKTGVFVKYYKRKILVKTGINLNHKGLNDRWIMMPV